MRGATFRRAAVELTRRGGGAASRAARSRAASSRATSDSSPNARAIALNATPSRASPRSATAASKRSQQLERARAATARRGAARGRAACSGRPDADGARGRADRRGAARPPPARPRWRSRARAERSRVRRRLDARLERVAPALVGELHLFERDARISVHGCSAGAEPTVMMWSAIWRGAAVGKDSLAGASGLRRARSRGRMPARRLTSARDRLQSDAPARSGRRARRRGVRT